MEQKSDMKGSGKKKDDWGGEAERLKMNDSGFKCQMIPLTIEDVVVARMDGKDGKGTDTISADKPKLH